MSLSETLAKFFKPFAKEEKEKKEAYDDDKEEEMSEEEKEKAKKKAKKKTEEEEKEAVAVANFVEVLLEVNAQNEKKLQALESKVSELSQKIKTLENTPIEPATNPNARGNTASRWVSKVDWSKEDL